MSRKSYHIRVKGELFEVSEDVYLCYYRSQRRSRYYEHDIKASVPVRDENQSITGFIGGKEESLERLSGVYMALDDEQESAEDIAVRNLMSEMLYKELNRLSEDERRLIYNLFFSNGGDGMTERECAKSLGITQQSVNERKIRIFNKLKKFLEK